MPSTEADSGDAFSAIAQKLDALLQAREQRAAAGLTPPPTDDEDSTYDTMAEALEDRPLVDPPPMLTPEVSEAEAVPELTLPEEYAEPAPLHADNDEPQAPSDTEANLQAAVADIDAMLSSAADAEPEDAPTLDPIPAAQTVASAEDNAIEPEPAPAAYTVGDGLDTSDDPTPHDLDAELEALLAEQPIDPAVLNAADEIAKRDAEEAEQNQDALKLRAEQAASALAEIAAGPADDAAHDDDITAEINDLLAAEEAQQSHDASLQADDADLADPAEDPTIDQIDQMLAAEVDDTDEVDGAFFSADDVVADNTSGPGESYEDESDVAGSFAAAEDVEAEPLPPGAETAGEPDAAAARRRLPFDWRDLLHAVDRMTLQLCWAINWPARKFLTAEWRATLGYVALLQAVGASAVWLLLVVL